MNKSEEILYNGKWLRLKAITYTTGEGGEEHVWETLERTTKRRARFDGLLITFFFISFQSPFVFIVLFEQLLRSLHLFILSARKTFQKRKET